MKSNVDKAESSWVRVLLRKRYKSVLMRSLWLLETAPSSQGRGWAPAGICTALLEQPTPQRITSSRKTRNFARRIGKLRESVGITSLGTIKRRRNSIAKVPTVSRLEEGLVSQALGFPAGTGADGACGPRQCCPRGRASLGKRFGRAGKENEVDPTGLGINKTYDTVPDSKLLCTEDGINKKFIWE